MVEADGMKDPDPANTKTMLGPDGPRPILVAPHLVALGILGSFLALSDSLKTSELGIEAVFYRLFFALGAIGMFCAAWKIWMRRPTTWRWYVLAIGICLVSMLVFGRVKALEKSSSKLGDSTHSR